MSTKSQVIGALYRNIFKPIAFREDPEKVHDRISMLGEALERFPLATSVLFAYKNPKLCKNVLGVEFESPIGLSAGFDYDGHMAAVMRDVGFGFNTVGTVTAKPYEGNPKPRLGRLPKSRSLLVNKGFKSEGARAVAARLAKKNLKGSTIGISVGSSNIPEVNTINKAIADYIYTFKVFKGKRYVKYFELNISCPNTAMKEPFTDPANFTKLVKKVRTLKLKPPVFVKMPNEISPKDSDKLVDIALENGIRGFIFSNLVKDRKNKFLDTRELKLFEGKRGNFSGKPAEKNANALIAHTRRKYKDKVAIIGVGGVFNCKDAEAKFAAGADLVQLVTGLIFEGPQMVGEICEGLAKSA